VFWGPFGLLHASYYEAHNKLKLWGILFPSVSLNLRRAQVYRKTRVSDVLIDSYVRGVLSDVKIKPMKTYNPNTAAQFETVLPQTARCYWLLPFLKKR
jgi:hypothetical protein